MRTGGNNQQNELKAKQLKGKSLKEQEKHIPQNAVSME